MDWFKLEAWWRERVWHPLWGLTACRFGHHRTAHWVTGKPASLCEACKAQLNPHTYRWYRVSSKDGLEATVAAVNEVQAKTFFAHHYHPANLSVTFIAHAEGMTLDQWRGEMREYIEQSPLLRAGFGGERMG